MMRMSMAPASSPAPPKVAAAGHAAAIGTPSDVWVRSLPLWHVWNIATKSFNVLGIPLQGKPLSPEWRLSVHFASDQIELWATGAPGISATRIAFKRDGKLWTIDSDGANATLIPGTDGAMSPSWHPSGRYLTYNLLPIEGMASAIVVRDLVTGSVQRIATAGRSGTYLTPVFSPDGGSLIYAYGLDQGTDLYLMDWAHPSSQPMRVTSTHTENTSPTFSPDGRRIAFTSGRLGPPQVYIADADGSSADPLTNSGFGEQSYRSNPAWSPDGRVIAIQSRINGVFQIVTVSPGGGIETLLTNEGQNEDPSWAPDGRHIVFKSNRTGSEQLWILDHESGRSRQLTHGSESKLAAWSPPLMRQKPSDRPDSPRTGGKQ